MASTETSTPPAAAAAADSNDDFGPNIRVSKHPVLSHKITILRSANTSSGQFRSVLREVTYHLGYEATSCMTTIPIPVSVSAGKESPNEHWDTCTGQKLQERVAVVPILRSGLGMSDGMLELLPKAAVHHIGMYRMPGSAPVQYFNRLPRKCLCDMAIVLDPVISSAQTSLAVIRQLKKWGAPSIHLISVLGSRRGLKEIEKNHPDVKITIGIIDDGLTEDGIVLPGLGDAGDRLFGTKVDDPNDLDESLLHPSKRSKTSDS